MINSIDIVNSIRNNDTFPDILVIKTEIFPRRIYLSGSIHVGKIIYDKGNWKFPIQHGGINKFDIKDIDHSSYKKVISSIIDKLIEMNTNFDCIFYCYNQEVFDYIKQFETLL